MGRKRQTRVLNVAMNGRRVGKLTLLSQGKLQFQYEPEWLATQTAPPLSLSLPLSTAAYTGEPVWNFFDNLLPNSDAIRRRMQTSLGAASTRPFDLLATAGKDCVGALQLSHEKTLPDVRQVTASPVDNAWIANRLKNYRSLPLGMSPDEKEFRISIAGVQEKTALLWYKGAWHQPMGTTPTTHIFKLPIGQAPSGIDLSDSVENEWLCLKLAAEFGLPVANARIQDFEDVRCLVVERFDRRWSKDQSWLIRLPQEDMCQSLGIAPGLKYESEGGPGIKQILDQLLHSETSSEDRSNFFRAIVVYWLLAAIDGHAKNFSIFLLGGGRYHMTPLYDILSAHPLVARKGLNASELKMAMALDGKNRHYRWKGIQHRHWISTAGHARFLESTASAVLEDCLARVPKVIETVSRSLPDDFPAELSDSVFRGIEVARKRCI